MHQSITIGCSIPDFCLQYGDYLFRVRGLATSTRKLHRHVVCRFLTLRFPGGKIILSELRFTDFVDFLKGEFTRLSSRETQRAWLTILRSVLRYLSEAGHIDWESGYLKVRSTKTYSDRILPLPQDVGRALVAHLRKCRSHPERIFEPLMPPFTAEHSYTHVLNSIRYVFGLAGINDRGAHSLRHTAATEMVNSGASFKDVDVLGHKSVTTTFIYAKLDMKSLTHVALPWPGSAR